MKTKEKLRIVINVNFKSTKAKVKDKINNNIMSDVSIVTVPITPVIIPSTPCDIAKELSLGLSLFTNPQPLENSSLNRNLEYWAPSKAKK